MIYQVIAAGNTATLTWPPSVLLAAKKIHLAMGRCANYMAADKDTLTLPASIFRALFLSTHLQTAISQQKTRQSYQLPEPS